MIEKNLIKTAAFLPKYLNLPAWIGHLPFGAWLIQELHPAIFVELGTHSGTSYFNFCQAVLEAKLMTKCYAVDSWKGDEHSAEYGEEVFVQVNDYNQKNYAQFSSLLRMTFDEALNYFADRSIELLHIDGFHTYEAVSHDFETWLPKLAPNAVVIFHDTMVRERNFGVWKFWEELKQKYPNHLEFFHSHGLGVIQLNNEENAQQHIWLQSSYEDKQPFISYFSALGSLHYKRYELELYKTEIANMKSLITETNLKIVQQEGTINHLNQTIIKKEETINHLNQTILPQEGTINSLNQTIIKHEKIITHLNQVTSHQVEVIKHLSHTVNSPKILFIWLLKPIKWVKHYLRKKFLPIDQTN